MSFLFQQLIYRPIFNLLVFIYNFLPGNDFGLAIILLTLLVRLVFSPWSIKAARSQKKLAQLQPQLKAIQEKHRQDKAAQAQATMALYKESGVSPVAGCLPLLVQLPFLIALYQAFFNGFKPESLNALYSFVARPEFINSTSLGFFNLAAPSVFLVLATGFLQFLQSRLSVPMPTLNRDALSAGLQKGTSQKARTSREDNFGIGTMNKQMLYFLPIMIIIIGWKLPAALVLYWAVTTLFSILEQLYVRKFRPI